MHLALASRENASPEIIGRVYGHGNA